MTLWKCHNDEGVCWISFIYVFGCPCFSILWLADCLKESHNSAFYRNELLCVSVARGMWLDSLLLIFASLSSFLSSRCQTALLSGPNSGLEGSCVCVCVSSKPNRTYWLRSQRSVVAVRTLGTSTQSSGYFSLPQKPSFCHHLLSRVPGLHLTALALNFVFFHNLKDQRHMHKKKHKHNTRKKKEKNQPSAQIMRMNSITSWNTKAKDRMDCSDWFPYLGDPRVWDY